MSLVDIPRESYGTVIVGGGPAGANFARLANFDDGKVLLIDGAPKNGKVCGGLISPDAQGVLARYDVNLPTDILVSPQLFSVRTIDLETRRVRYYKRNYLNVNRAELDKYFLKMVPDGIEGITARCVSVKREGQGFLLTVEKSGVRYEVRCDRVVGADGASSVVRSNLFPKKKLKKYTAIQQWFAAEGSDPCYSCVFDSSTSDSCSWIFFKDGMLIFGGAFEAQGSRAAFDEQKRKLVQMGAVGRQAFDSPVRTEACRVVRPTLSGGIFCGDGGAFLIGEAAGFISPSSLEGISFALESSEALADAFEASSDSRKMLKKYKGLTQKLRAKVAVKCLKRPFMYQKLLRNAVMRSGVTAIKLKTQKNK